MDTIETISSRWLAIALLGSGMMLLGGCRICADCEDGAYGAYGGAWQRTRPDGGRVGSIFDPGGARASELVPRDTPPDPDEVQRKFQESRGGKSYAPDEERADRDADKEPDGEREKDAGEKNDELRERKLDDIEEKREDELNKRKLDDINVRIVPGQPTPPLLK